MARGDPLRVECYGATRTQDGCSVSADAFLIQRGVVTWAAVCDGAGNAGQIAKRAMRVFQTVTKQATGEQAMADASWTAWTKLLDSALLGGPEATFAGAAVVGTEVCGAVVGDARAYVLPFGGPCTIVTDGKARLGSGRATPTPIRRALQPRDVLLLMTDGAWTPLSPYILGRTLRQKAVAHFSDVPVAILDAAGRHGRADDMTVVALRI